MNGTLRPLSTLFCLTISLLLATSSFSQSRTLTFDASPSPIALSGLVNLQNATMTQDNAQKVCQVLAGQTENKDTIGGSYCIFHIIRWSEPDAKTNLQSVAQEHWYLYDPNDSSDQAYTENKRLMGIRDFYFFYIQINRAGGPTHKLPADSSNKPLVSELRPTYGVVVTKKLSANIQHLLSLGSQYLGGTTATQTLVPQNTEKLKSLLKIQGDPDSEFGGGAIHGIYHPSDIAITPSAQAVPAGADNPAQPGPTQLVAMGTKEVFDNEGKYYFDFSVAVPIKKISQTQINATNLTATPVNVDSTNAFMMFNLYLPPIDVKTNAWRWIPHPLTGAAFAKQPLHKILLGGGWGPNFSELYMGVMWVNQARLSPGATSCKTPPAGTTVDPNTGNHMCPQFSIGINLPIAAVASRLGAPK